MNDLTDYILVSSSPVVWIVLDFNSNRDLYSKFAEFKLANQVFPEPCGGYSGIYKDSYCYSPENAQKIISWLESKNV